MLSIKVLDQTITDYSYGICYLLSSLNIQFDVL